MACDELVHVGYSTGAILRFSFGDSARVVLVEFIAGAKEQPPKKIIFFSQCLMRAPARVSR
jgi:hypothetical protein